MKRHLASIGSILVAAPLAAAADNELRFPRPDFSTGYQQPITAVPAFEAPAFAWLDPALLGVALLAAAWLLLVRRSRRGIFLLTILSLLYFGFYRRGCVCPIGAVQNVAAGLVAGTAVPFAILLAFVLPLAAALLFGRVFCAAVCPLGALQDLVICKPLRLPPWTNEVLRLLPVVYLGLAVQFAVSGSTYLICKFDPFVGFFRLGAQLPMLLFGAALLGLGLVIARPYCRFLCPYGVLLGWCSLLARRHVKIAEEPCIECRLCATSCPVDAIDGPVAFADTAGDRPRAARRFWVAVALCPVLVVFGGYSFATLGTAGGGGPPARLLPSSAVDPTLALAASLAAETAAGNAGSSFATRHFLASRRTPAGLREEAAARRAGLRHWGWLCGGAVGMVAGLRLIARCRRPTRRGYEANREQCVGCARCIPYCPVKKGMDYSTWIKGA